MYAEKVHGSPAGVGATFGSNTAGQDTNDT